MGIVERRPAWRFVSIVGMALLLAPSGLRGQAAADYPPALPDATREIYRLVGSDTLALWIFRPEASPSVGVAPAVVFFFGGGFTTGTPSQFAPQARALAARGLVALVVDYRVYSRQGARAPAAVLDAKAAVRWVRQNAGRLGIDPGRIAAAGGSSGGYLAAATAVIRDIGLFANDIGESRPDALILFNPLLITAPAAEVVTLPAEQVTQQTERLGGCTMECSTYHQLRSGTAPTLIVHGTADQTVPFGSSQAFCRRMQSLGDRCELVSYPGAVHGFFNSGKAYLDTLRNMEDFLVSLGWLRPVL